MLHKLSVTALTAALLLTSGTVITQANTADGRQRIRFDDNWKFAPNPSETRQGDAITAWKALRTTAVTALGTDAVLPDVISSSEWKPVRIGDEVFGYRNGFAWFKTEITDNEQQVYNNNGVGSAGSRKLHFESVDDNCIVFVNGKRLIKHEGWDDEFYVDATKAWNYPGVNQLVLLVENTGGGGGIMKPVTLEKGSHPAASLGPAGAAFNDSGWRTVHLPHDYVVEGVFSPKEDASHGSLAAGAAWYRKSFELPADCKGRSIWLDFDGIYRDAVVYLNGNELARQPSGYMGFRVDISKSALVSQKNVLAVHVNAHKQEGWWYEGGGIYRHVWLNIANPIHTAPWGVYVQPEVIGAATESSPSAKIKIETRLVNESGIKGDVQVVSTIISPTGARVASISAGITVGANKSELFTPTIVIPSVTLWSIESPKLYTLHTEIKRGVKAIDTTDTVFGIRSIRFDAAKGFFLNGKPVKLKGTCNHQDFAGVGIAMPDSLLYWRIKKLKEMGSNAYRCSHNPPAAELLDACDRLGMVVMEETRHLGDTYSPKTSKGTPASDLSDLKAMLVRDRNHPSIIMWSLCNEEGLQGDVDGARIFKAMKDVVHQYDLSRPVSCAMNGGWGHGITFVEDLQGINYSPGSYDDFHKSFPDMPLYGSETASTVSTRGIYANDAKAGYVSAYDVNFPGWADTAEDAWRPIAERDYVAGGFVWTGFDYKGEPTPYAWPCINSHFGIMDECGFPKDNWYYYKAWWGDKPIVHILPHWNWAGSSFAEKPVSVWCHSNCERVELFLNGTSLGSKDVPKYGHVEWQVPYTVGKLEAIGYNGDKRASTDVVETAGAPVSLRISSDKKILSADGEDVILAEISVVDSHGRVVPTADNLVTFKVVGGAARVAGVGNGDASSHEPDRATKRSAFNGYCLAVVQATNTAGRITLTAASPGLASATVTLEAKPSNLK